MDNNHQLATFAGGCFWCMVKPFDEQPGIISVVSGYTGEQLKTQLINRCALIQLGIMKPFKLRMIQTFFRMKNYWNYFGSRLTLQIREASSMIEVNLIRQRSFTILNHKKRLPKSQSKH